MIFGLETRHEALQVEDADIVVVAYGSVSRWPMKW